MAKSKIHFAAMLSIGVMSATLLAGCGGGGGEAATTPTTPVTPATTTFALDAGYKARLASGANDNFSVTGFCVGTANISIAPKTTSNFEGTSNVASTGHVSTVNATGCLAAPVVWTTYYDVNDVPIGMSVNGGQYSVLKAGTQPVALPATVTVTATETPFSTMTNYADSTKTVVNGEQVRSYLIEPFDQTNAIANFITRSYNAGGALVVTEQARYRMATDGTLTPLSIDVQYSPPSTIHIVFTKQ